MGTDSLGCTSSITHQINIKDEIPVRRKAYPTPVHKQKFIDDEIAKILEKKNNQTFYLTMGCPSSTGTKEGWECALLC